MMRRLLDLVALPVLIFALGSPTVVAQSAPMRPPELAAELDVLELFEPVVAATRAGVVEVLVEGSRRAYGTSIGEGFILTKASELGADVTCRLPDGRRVAAERVADDDDWDLALLKIAVLELPPVAFVADTPAVGQLLASVGRSVRPLAVGVMSIPPARVPGGGYLGVVIETVAGGARVVRVEPKSPAMRAGILLGDVILQVGASAIDGRDALVRRITDLSPGRKTPLTVRRGDRTLVIETELATREDGDDGSAFDGRSLSVRRGGFPSALQHDAVISARDCGAPIVDVSGRAVGLNIARAGRTRTLALAGADVKEAVARLLAAARPVATKAEAEAGPARDV